MSNESGASAAVQLAEQFIAYRKEIHQLRAVLQLCPLPVLLAHHDGRLVLYVNPAYTFFLGGALADVQDGKWIEHWCPEDRPKMQAHWNDVCVNKKTTSTEGNYIFPPNQGLKKARVTTTVVDNNGIVSFIFPEICWDVPLPIQLITPQLGQ